MVNSDNPSFKFSLKDVELFGNKHKSNRHSHDRNNRSNKSRYSDNYRRNDRRRDRNDRDKDRRRRDSHSRSKNRDSSSGHDKIKRQDSVSNTSQDENKKPAKIADDQKHNADITDNSEFYIGVSYDMHKKSSENNQTEINVANENNLNFDHFSIESLNEISVEKKSEPEVETKEIIEDFEINKESQLIYDKFLKEKFVPFPSISDVRKIDDVDSNSSPKISSDLVLKSFHKSNKIDLYSPGMESSRESSPLQTKNPVIAIAQISENIQPENIKQIHDKKIDNIYDSWLNIDKVCKPTRHSSSSCIRFQKFI